MSDCLGRRVRQNPEPDSADRGRRTQGPGGVSSRLGLSVVEVDGVLTPETGQLATVVVRCLPPLLIRCRVGYQ